MVKEIFNCPVCGENSFPLVTKALVYAPDKDTAIYVHPECMFKIFTEWMKANGKWQGQKTINEIF
jgi:hypothetical protein